MSAKRPATTLVTDEAQPGDTIAGRLFAANVDRRSFLKYCAVVTGVLALPPAFAPRIAQALEQKARPTVVWLELQDCAGDSESLLRARNPSVADLILDVLSLDCHETVMAAAGHQAEAARDAAVARGGHLVVVEGSVPLGAGGGYCTIGGQSAEQILRAAAKGAAAIINVGTCSAYGGIPAASPNPTKAVAVGDIISDVPIINLPGCPMNVDNLTATVVHYLTFGGLPPVDDKGRPLFAYGSRIHDNCPRRGHFDAGQFALAWGDEGHRNGYCLYRLRCKGPSTFHNCPTVQWNGSTNWPIGAGHGCVGCSEPAFWDDLTPIYDRLPHVAAAGLDLTAEKLGLTVVGATALGFGAHGVGKIVQHKLTGHSNEYSGPPGEHHPETGEPVAVGTVDAASAGTDHLHHGGHPDVGSGGHEHGAHTGSGGDTSPKETP